MSKKRQPLTPDPAKQEKQTYRHKQYAWIRLRQAIISLDTLDQITALFDEPSVWKVVRRALISDAIIAYVSPFKRSNTGPTKNENHCLEKEDYVPKESYELHDRLVDCRDKLFAHFDYDFQDLDQKEDGTSIAFWAKWETVALQFTDDDIQQMRQLAVDVCDKIGETPAAEPM